MEPEQGLRVIHFADVHLGIENYGRLDPSTGLPTRLADFLAAMDQIINVAEQGHTDLILFAGDAYRTRDPSPTYQREFARRIRRLSLAGVPTVLVAGNHDVPNAVGRAHTLEIFGTLDVENVYVAHSPDILSIETPHGPVQVGVIPWIVRSGLLSRDEHKNKNLDQVTDLLLQRVEQILYGDQGLASRLDPHIPHILVAHGTVQGAIYGSERSVMLGQEMALPLGLLKNSAWDYVALGHIHRHQALEDDRLPPVVYAGSVERIDFGEEREDKGYVTAEVTRGRSTWVFHKLNARRFVTVQVTAHGDDPTAEVLHEIERADVRDSVVRVIIHTTADRDVLIREQDIRRALKDAFSVAAIVHDVVRPERLRLGDQQEIASLAPLQALERYLQVKQTPPERIAVLVGHAQSLLAGCD
jgi:exonuclease SbcD